VESGAGKREGEGSELTAGGGASVVPPPVSRLLALAGRVRTTNLIVIIGKFQKKIIPTREKIFRGSREHMSKEGAT
jgi:hypothetical protein